MSLSSERLSVGKTTNQLSRQPTNQSAYLPSKQATKQPSNQPASQPVYLPTSQSTYLPTNLPINKLTYPKNLPLVLLRDFDYGNDSFLAANAHNPLCVMNNVTTHKDFVFSHIRAMRRQYATLRVEQARLKEGGDVGKLSWQSWIWELDILVPK